MRTRLSRGRALLAGKLRAKRAHILRRDFRRRSANFSDVSSSGGPTAPPAAGSAVQPAAPHRACPNQFHDSKRADGPHKWNYRRLRTEFLSAVQHERMTDHAQAGDDEATVARANCGELALPYP